MTLQLDAIANSPGYFKAQKVRGGAWLPARFWIVEQRDHETGERIGDDRYFAELGTDPVDAFNPPGWPYGWHAVQEWEWRHMHDDLSWALHHDRNGPMANPDRPARTAERMLF